jgi:hypothetical protein
MPKKKPARDFEVSLKSTPHQLFSQLLKISLAITPVAIAASA